MKKVVVISLGGSLIVPEKIDHGILKKFKQTIEKNYSKYKFVIVCGGGVIARKYISILKAQKKNEKEISLGGIRATRMNALLMMQLFSKNANKTLPRSIKDVENDIKRNNVVFCGALRYADKETSDGTAAKIARYFKGDLINMTNIKGLYSANPKKNKKAKFISEITWERFEKKALAIKYQPGQHFVLDQNAAKIIKKNKIKTYIIGSDSSNIDKILKDRKFIGTLISK
jgi:uridylate kinase